jgi:hypothetical protein
MILNKILVTVIAIWLKGPAMVYVSRKCASPNLDYQ